MPGMLIFLDSGSVNVLVELVHPNNNITLERDGEKERKIGLSVLPAYGSYVLSCTTN